MSRIIGMRPRDKVLADGTSSPTQVAIYVNGKFEKPEKLKNEDEELAFVKTLQYGDIVVMLLGGSGDYLAYAMARYGEEKEVNSKVFRLPAHVFQNVFGSDRDKNKDPEQLVNLYLQDPKLFYHVSPRDREIITLREMTRARRDAMKARIACGQRLRQRYLGRAFCNPEGYFPEGKIEKEFDDIKASDLIYQALLHEEELRDKELSNFCKRLLVYKKIFQPVVGCGPMIAARIISAVVHIGRFSKASKLRGFCGVHLLKDGRFPRKRSGSVANWNNDCRQALYLLGDQFNRHPDSFWGQKLREAKANYRIKHPEILVENGKMRYTDGHIHQMALWYTLGKFVVWLYHKWSKFEEEQAVMQD